MKSLVVEMFPSAFCREDYTVYALLFYPSEEALTLHMAFQGSVPLYWLVH